MCFATVRIIKLTSTINMDVAMSFPVVLSTNHHPGAQSMKVECVFLLSILVGVKST